MVKKKLVDAVVATSAAMVDMDFFEALGFKHYIRTSFIDDKMLRDNYIDRIYDTYIDEEELQVCDMTIKGRSTGLHGFLNSMAVTPSAGMRWSPGQVTVV